jgi:iron complex outermembrane receptor protein
MLSVATQLAHTERAPTFYELFANGPHAATSNYELGNSRLDVEKSNSIDLQLRLKHGEHSGSVGVFHSRFSNFIALSGTGVNRDEDGLINPGGELPEFVYRAVPAKFSGSRRRPICCCADVPANCISTCRRMPCAPATATPVSRCRALRRCAARPR